MPLVLPADARLRKSCLRWDGCPMWDRRTPHLHPSQPAFLPSITPRVALHPAAHQLPGILDTGPICVLTQTRHSTCWALGSGHWLQAGPSGAAGRRSQGLITSTFRIPEGHWLQPVQTQTGNATPPLRNSATRPLICRIGQGVSLRAVGVRAPCSSSGAGRGVAAPSFFIVPFL